METTRSAEPTKTPHEIYTLGFVELLNRYVRKGGARFGYQMGRVWARVYRDHGSHKSAVYFVSNKAAIHKAVSWKKPGLRIATDTDRWNMDLATNGPASPLLPQTVDVDGKTYRIVNSTLADKPELAPLRTAYRVLGVLDEVNALPPRSKTRHVQLHLGIDKVWRLASAQMQSDAARFALRVANE